MPSYMDLYNDDVAARMLCHASVDFKIYRYNNDKSNMSNYYDICANTVQHVINIRWIFFFNILSMGYAIKTDFVLASNRWCTDTFT